MSAINVSFCACYTGECSPSKLLSYSNIPKIVGVVSAILIIIAVVLINTKIGGIWGANAIAGYACAGVGGVGFFSSTIYLCLNWVRSRDRHSRSVPTNIPPVAEPTISDSASVKINLDEAQKAVATHQVRRVPVGEFSVKYQESNIHTRFVTLKYYVPNPTIADIERDQAPEGQKWVFHLNGTTLKSDERVPLDVRFPEVKLIRA